MAVTQDGQITEPAMNSLELALAIAIPVTFGVCLLVAVPFFVKCWRRRNRKKQTFKKIDIEKAIWGHTRNISETNTPLLTKSEHSSSTEHDDDFPLPSPDRNMTFVFPAPSALPSNPQPFYAPPSRDNAKTSLPVAEKSTRPPSRSPLSQVQTRVVSPPAQPQLLASLPPVRYIPPTLQPSSPPLPQVLSQTRQEQGSVLPPSLSRSKTPDLLRRPSFLTQPREAPSFLGPQRTKSRRRPQPTLARIATTRSTRNYHAEDEQAPPSPVSTASIYSQSSATTSVWNAFEQPWNTNKAIPPIPEHPSAPASPPTAFGTSGDRAETSGNSRKERKRDNTVHSISDSFHSDSYFGEEDSEVISPSRLTESPLQYDPFWSHVLGDNKLTTSDLKEPAIRTNPESVASHPPKQVSDPSMTYSVPVYGVVSKEGKHEVYDRWDAIPITPTQGRC
ncbi:hypothetical protein QCA50_005823 [Cerrena zonata]|uniref:Uncharacterized protein n=1 Tax=Cerrena zonata TaxID=2478898 RepID=A0AAW0GHT3_9APHY